MKKRNRTALSLLSLCLLSAASPAETYHSGTVSADETWTLAGSPHIVNDQLYLNAKVTVEPEVTVVTWADVHVYEHGSILAIGLPDKPIRFGSYHYNMHIWSETPSVFRYCRFLNFDTIYFLDAMLSASHLFQHCSFQGGGQYGAVNVWASPVRVLNCTFLHNSGPAIVIGLYDMTPDLLPTIRNNAIIGPGIEIQGNNGSAWNEPIIQDNHVTGPYGIRLTMDSVQGLLIKNCRFNCPTGIVNECVSSLDVTVAGCDLASVAGPMPLSGNLVLTNNWWGTTNSAEIGARIFGGSLDESAFMPCATKSCFQQADVDGSAGGNATGQEDATMVKEHIVGLRQLTPEQQTIADVDNDNDVDLRDALMIESFVKGTLWRLPSP
ncbi:MAG: right-handed parallel beta-helix repeat-containing protein [Kiritimatiellae bacterium]|nr:right-handed parallel beta-helix repeat-containing protein [Kiritimatiellia bacterium]